MTQAYPPKISDMNYVQAAKRLRCDVSSIRAVAEVESRGDGFVWFDHTEQPEWRPKILFERHVMCKRYEDKYGYDKTIEQIKHHPDIINTYTGGYIGGASEHKRLKKARRLDKNIGLESASWGIFQIMGYHWRQLGYKSVVDFVLTLSTGEPAHLEAFVRFIENNETLLTAIRAKDWRLFARTYNGRNYAKNKYDIKMGQAERRWRKLGVNDPMCVSQISG